MTFEEVVYSFGARPTGGRSCKVKCPAHRDKQSSLQISRGSKGVILHCHAGCSTEAILDKVGLTMADLYYEPPKKQTWKEYVEKAVSKKTGKPVKVEARYDLTYLDGRYAYTKLRLTGKEMRYGVISGDRWSWGLPADSKGRKQSRADLKAVFSQSVMGFRAAAAVGGRVFYAEGEKDVLTLEKWGCTAVTAGASGDWLPEFAQLFKGGDVILCGDYDSPGVELIRQIRRDLQGIAKAVTVIFPYTAMIGGDVSDYFTEGGTYAGLIDMVEAEQRDRRYATDEALRDLSIELKARKEQPEACEDTEPEPVDLARFHHFGKSGAVTGVYDWELFQYLKGREHIVVIGQIPYVYVGGRYVADKQGAMIRTWISELIYPQYIKAPTIKRIYDLFLSRSEFTTVPEDMNQYPASWVCFRNGMYDPVARKMHPHDPKHRALNQVPHEFDPEARPTGEHIEAWLRFAIPDEDDREMVLEYLGYCLTRDTRQQVFLVFQGFGGSGKSTLLDLLEAMVGMSNVSTKAPEQLSQRFAAFSLMGKLVNVCADISATALEDTSILKQVLGEDLVDGEAKGKDAITFRSYAKLLYSANEIPTILNERTNGFYRRLIVCPMNAQLPEDQVRPDFMDELIGEIDYLIRICMDALGRMYERGRILRSQHSREAVQQVRVDSDSVEAWIEERMYRVPEAVTRNTELYQSYKDYCEGEGIKMNLGRKSFYKALRNKAFTEKRLSSGTFFVGLTGDSSQASTITTGEDVTITFTEVRQIEIPFTESP